MTKPKMKATMTATMLRASNAHRQLKRPLGTDLLPQTPDREGTDVSLSTRTTSEGRATFCLVQLRPPPAADGTS